MRALASTIKAQCELGVPICLGMAIQFLLGFIDTIMLGHYQYVHKAIAISALALACFNVVFVFLIGFTSAFGILFSRENGKGNTQQLSVLFTTGFLMTLMLGGLSALGLNLLNVGFVPVIVVNTLQSPVQTYLFALSIGIPGALVFMFFRECFNATLNPRPVVTIVLLALPLNVLLDYCLLYGKFGFPAVGVSGVAYATSLCDWFMAIALGGVFI